MNEVIATGEKSGPRWSPIVENNLQDGRDLYVLHAEFNGFEADDVASQHQDDLKRLTRRAGLLLKKGKESVGYVTYKIIPTAWISESEQACLLYVNEIFVREQNRSPSATVGFLASIRAMARENSAEYIGWTTGSPVMVELSQRLELNAKDMGELHILPVDSLDIRKLTGRL